MINSSFDNFGDLTDFAYNEFVKLSKVKSLVPRKFRRRQKREIIKYYFMALGQIKFFGKVEEDIDKTVLLRRLENVKTSTTEKAKALAQPKEVITRRLSKAEQLALVRGALDASGEK